MDYRKKYFGPVFFVALIYFLMSLPNPQAVSSSPERTFSHSTHLPQFSKLGVTCTDCHRFDVKAKMMDPLGKPVPKGLVHAQSKMCTECHGTTPNTKFQNRCVLCHVEKTISKFNHSPSKLACGECHHPTNFSHSSLKIENSKHCLDCHVAKNFKHRDLSAFAQTERARGLHFPNGQIDCLTCHQMHNSLRLQKLKGPSTPVLVFCASCHGTKSTNYFLHFHDWMKKGRLPIQTLDKGG